MTAAVIMCSIARWKPNARERLQAAALDLFAERGYDQTTAAEIAARADLTERTFFRHFADKREVLFANEATMQAALVAGVQGADTGYVQAGLEAVAAELEPRRAELRRRAELIASHPALRERELIKQAATVTALAAALKERGVAAGEAELSAEVAIVLLRVAFDRWLATDDGDLRSQLAAVRDSSISCADQGRMVSHPKQTVCCSIRYGGSADRTQYVRQSNWRICGPTVPGKGVRPGCTGNTGVPPGSGGGVCAEADAAGSVAPSSASTRIALRIMRAESREAAALIHTAAPSPRATHAGTETSGCRYGVVADRVSVTRLL